MANQKKVSAVQDIANKIQSNPNITLIGFEATSHKSLELLRRSLKQVNAQAHVVKSALLEKAVVQITELKEFAASAFPIKHQTAIVYMKGDWSQALKAIYEFAKKETTVMFKSAFLDNTFYSPDSLRKLATLPSKTVLLGKVVGSLKSPVNRVDYAIKFPMTYFVNTLKARVTKG